MSWYDPYNAALSAGYMPLGSESQAAKPAVKAQSANDAAVDPAPAKIDIQPKAENAPVSGDDKAGTGGSTETGGSAETQQSNKPAVPEQILPAPLEGESNGGLKLNGAEPDAAADANVDTDAKLSTDKDI
jgi:hypothetical protein